MQEGKALARNHVPRKINMESKASQRDDINSWYVGLDSPQIEQFPPDSQESHRHHLNRSVPGSASKSIHPPLVLITQHPDSGLLEKPTARKSRELGT